MKTRSSTVVIVLCVALSGCAVQLHGNQSGSGTTTSSAVAASTGGSNVRAGFSSGQAVSGAAPGGQLSVNGGGGTVAAVLLVGAIVVDFLNSLGAVQAQVKPLPPDARISHTCSCYGWQPPAKAEEGVIRDR